MAAAAELLSDTSAPTAVVCANDRIAVGVIDTLRRSGVLVPEDISVTGYDDSMLARLGHIDLTTVSQQPREQAEKAVRALVSRLDGGRVDRESWVLQPRLAVRATTAAPHPDKRS